MEDGDETAERGGGEPPPGRGGRSSNGIAPFGIPLLNMYNDEYYVVRKFKKVSLR